MAPFFRLDRITIAVCDAPARDEARRRAGAAYAAGCGPDLLQTLDAAGQPRAMRSAVALLFVLELGRAWDAATRARLDAVQDALERLMTSSKKDARRAAV